MFSDHFINIYYLLIFETGLQYVALIGLELAM